MFEVKPYQLNPNESGNLPFQCTECGKGSARNLFIVLCAKNLRYLILQKKHFYIANLTHPVNKPFQCAHCGETFIWKILQFLHLNIVGSLFVRSKGLIIQFQINQETYHFDVQNVKKCLSNRFATLFAHKF